MQKGGGFGMGNTAVVVGGGIGGLAAAIGLRRIGWEVTVVERAFTLEDAGAGISLAANGLRALDELESARRYRMPREASTAAVLARHRVVG